MSFISEAHNVYDILISLMKFMSELKAVVWRIMENAVSDPTSLQIKAAFLVV